MAVIALTAYLLLFAPVNPRSEQYLFTISTGSSISTVIAEMVEDNYLRSQLGGKIAFAFSNTQVVQPGVFNISPRMNAWQIASVIKSGETAGTRVTIPEGYSISQIASRLETSQITSAREFTQALSEIDKKEYTFLSTTNRQVINPFEGYLFPDTYEFYKGMPAAQVVQRLLDNFSTRTSGLSSEIESSGFTIQQIVTLASLIEREANNEEDRKLIAGVILNRLDLGMRLDIDASVRFIFDNWSDPITSSQLSSSSPYNTRRVAGLPPGPICNPGLAAMKAILNPTNSDYLYYLTDSDGVTHYATTLDQHNVNKAKYIR